MSKYAAYAAYAAYARNTEGGRKVENRTTLKKKTHAQHHFPDESTTQ